jgi:hypothetical protein
MGVKDRKSPQCRDISGVHLSGEAGKAMRGRHRMERKPHTVGD